MSLAVRCAEFGPFRLFASERRLVRQGETVLLGSRALDILIVLIEQPGSIVTKQELMARVWPDLTVEEGSLRVHIASLRKALGDGRDGASYIVNSAGRGYSFACPVTYRDTAPTTPPPSASPSTPASHGITGLPRRPARMIGRDDDVAAIADLLAAQRFVSVHGPGGIGKTTAALAVAHDQAGGFEDGISFLDFGLHGRHDSAPGILAAALGLMVQASDPTPSILDFLRDRRMLLVFDCCEHVIESAALLAEAIVRDAPQVSILATSREPLRAEGEHVYALPPLKAPPTDIQVSADRLLDYPAARLFLERAAAGGHRNGVSESDAQIVADICRKVDGIALALELAAGRVSTHGLQETATLLDSRLKLLWQGRRTALPRHQTLYATLDWSHGLIEMREQTVLRRLSIFMGPFTLDEAREVVADTDIDETGVVEAIALLVSKSLVIAETGEERTRYRLLDITRSYAQAKLAEAGEVNLIARKHALYYLKLLVSSRPGRQPDEQVTGEFRLSSLANIRAGLEWSFSADGDPALGSELVAAASRIYRELSMLAECRQWSERALAALGDNMRGTRCEMELQTAHAYCLMFTQGNSEQARAAFERGLQIAETLGARFHQFRLLSGLHMYHRRMGDFGQLLGLARQAEAIAPDLGDETAITAANILLGASHHLIGNHPEARIALSASLQPPANRHRFATNFYGFHRGALIVLGRTLWLQGFPDQAIKAAREAEFEEQQDPVSRCLAFIWGMSIFHWAGDWETVESYVDQLIQYAGEHSLEPYRAVGIGFKGDMLARRGDATSGLRLLRESLGRLQADRYDLYIPWLTCILARTLAEAGELGPALDRMNGLFLSSDPRNDAYDLPERLRMRGELLAKAGDASTAEDCFRDAIIMADRQTALSWRLRTATSLARLWSQQQQRRDEARTMLTETYARFTEGFETADLRAARSLLGELEQPDA